MHKDQRESDENAAGDPTSEEPPRFRKFGGHTYSDDKETGAADAGDGNRADVDVRTVHLEAFYNYLLTSERLWQGKMRGWISDLTPFW